MTEFKSRIYLPRDDFDGDEVFEGKAELVPQAREGYYTFETTITVSKPKKYIIPLPGTGDGVHMYFMSPNSNSVWTPEMAVGQYDALQKKLEVSQDVIANTPEWIQKLRKVEVDY